MSTVTVTVVDSVWLPAASRATAVMVCEPSLTEAVFLGIEYGALVSSAPKLTLSILNCTPTTPTLSEALAVKLVVPETVAPETGDVMLTVGGVVSAGDPLATVTVTESEVVLPAASRATAVMV